MDGTKYLIFKTKQGFKSFYVNIKPKANRNRFRFRYFDTKHYIS